MTLTEFLLARIAEDEAVARSASEAEITTVSHEHIARWNPPRVLAECEAKRRIIQIAEQGCECQASATAVGNPFWDIATLHALAMPYADHPDYQQEWAL